jgi:hypothetical protein
MKLQRILICLDKSIFYQLYKFFFLKLKYLQIRNIFLNRKINKNQFIKSFRISLLKR